MREMKDSGVKWIGVIPADWEFIKFKYTYLSTNSGEVIDKGYWNSGDEYLYTCKKTQMLSDYPNFPDHKRTTGEDILLTRNATPYVFLPVKNAIYTNVVQRVILKAEWDRRFIKYALQCGAENYQTYGISIPSYNLDVWNGILIANLPLTIQMKIVDYIEKELAKIGVLIANVQSQIEKLKAYKQSLITEAVTKGLDCSVAMKDSGVEWLGKVPEKWVIHRIANLYSERSENGHADLPILTVSINTGVSDYEVADADKDRVFIRMEDRSKYKRVCPGDLTYNMMRAWQGAFGAVRVDGMVSPAYVVAKPKNPVQIDSRYIEALLRTPSAIEEMHRYSRGIVDFRLRLYWPEFRSIHICLPPIEEQTQIADYIDEKSKQIDKLIAIKQKKIDKLNEYKKSLIYEYVTGKRAVV